MEQSKMFRSPSVQIGPLTEIETNLLLQDGTSIYARAWTPAQPRLVVICVQGLGGHGGYYHPLAGELAPAGIVVVAPDLQGHGRSTGVRGDIRSFARYLEDVDVTVQWARASFPHLPLILLGESMGASIAIRYLASAARYAHTAQIAGLALLSPVLRAVVHPRLSEVTRFLLSSFTPTRPAMLVTGREELGCRDEAFNDQLRGDPLFVRRVSVRFLSILNGWLGQARRSAGQIKLPLLVLQGGCDYIAHPAGTSAFLRRVATREQQVMTFSGVYHCLLHDPETPAVINELLTWLEGFVGRRDELSNALEALEQASAD
jgi:alpha-beta hydrolase superfamily lysophospholipase